MSKRDYGTKLAESLRQARQLGAVAPTQETPATPATTARPSKQTPAVPVRNTVRAASSHLHPARVWPD